MKNARQQYLDYLSTNALVACEAELVDRLRHGSDELSTARRPLHKLILADVRAILEERQLALDLGPAAARTPSWRDGLR